jgi:putative DNA primase/helicase
MTSAPQTSVANNPPRPLHVDPDGIPGYLKARPQFVVWRFECRDGEWTKVPYNPCTVRRALTTDLLTWVPFAEALEALESSKYDGLGFCFCSADPFVGIDFDDCRNPKTGEVDSRTLEYIEKFKDCYVEVSVSGTGIHLITRGKIQGGAKKGAYELYDQDRFFCMTGVAL